MGRVLVGGDVLLDSTTHPPYTGYGGAGRVARAAADVAPTTLWWPYGRNYVRANEQTALSFIRWKPRLQSSLRHHVLSPGRAPAPLRPAQKVYGPDGACLRRTPADYFYVPTLPGKSVPPHDVLCLVDHDEPGDLCLELLKLVPREPAKPVVISTRRPQRYVSQLLNAACVLQWAAPDCDRVYTPHVQLVQAARAGSALLVTRGSLGADYYHNGVRTHLATGIPSSHVIPEDATIGAGDAVTGILAGLLACGEHRLAAAQMAVYVASYAVTSPGMHRGVLPIDQATPLHSDQWRRLLRMARAVTSTPEDVLVTADCTDDVIYIPGCFDRLHAGHRHLLEAATSERRGLTAGCCTYVLAIPTDESIIGKGSRPPGR